MRTLLAQSAAQNVGSSSRAAPGRMPKNESPSVKSSTRSRTRDFRNIGSGPKTHWAAVLRCSALQAPEGRRMPEEAAARCPSESEP